MDIEKKYGEQSSLSHQQSSFNTGFRQYNSQSNVTPIGGLISKGIFKPLPVPSINNCLGLNLNTMNSVQITVADHVGGEHGSGKKRLNNQRTEAGCDLDESSFSSKESNERKRDSKRLRKLGEKALSEPILP